MLSDRGSKVLELLAIFLAIGIINLIASVPIARVARLRGYSFFRWLLIGLLAGVPLTLYFLGRLPDQKLLRVRERELAAIDEELARTAVLRPSANHAVAAGTVGDAPTIG